MRYFLPMAIALAGCIPNQRTPGIVLSFDDRTIREWTLMHPLLQHYQANVTFFITQADSLQNEEKEILKDWERAGHEIGSHGAMHVLAEDYIQKHSYREYINHELKANSIALANAGLTITSFAYPYGSTYWLTDFIAGHYFSAVRGVAAVGQQSVTEMDEIYCQHNCSRVDALGFDVNSGTTRQIIAKGLTYARDNKKIIFLYAHAPCVDKEDGYCFSLDTLEFILQEAQKNSLRFYTFREIQ